MKHLFSINLFLSILICCTSCATRITKESQLPKKHIGIGSYGGITGMNEKFVILKNGLVYSSEKMPGGVAKISFAKKIPKKEARRIYKTMNKINFNNLKNDAPANMNFYIERNRCLRKDRSYRWSNDLDSTNKDHRLILNLLNFKN